jgi:hypothetical protein
VCKLLGGRPVNHGSILDCDNRFLLCIVPIRLRHPPSPIWSEHRGMFPKAAGAWNWPLTFIYFLIWKSVELFLHWPHTFSWRAVSLTLVTTLGYNWASQYFCWSKSDVYSKAANLASNPCTCRARILTSSNTHDLGTSSTKYHPFIKTRKKTGEWNKNYEACNNQTKKKMKKEVLSREIIIGSHILHADAIFWLQLNLATCFHVHDVVAGWIYPSFSKNTNGNSARVA